MNLKKIIIPILATVVILGASGCGKEEKPKVSKTEENTPNPDKLKIDFNTESAKVGQTKLSAKISEESKIVRDAKVEFQVLKVGASEPIKLEGKFDNKIEKFTADFREAKEGEYEVTIIAKTYKTGKSEKGKFKVNN